MNNLVKLGIFTIAGLAALVVSIVAVGNWDFAGRNVVYSYFGNVAGLNAKAKVKIAGVDVGSLEDVILEGRKVKLKMVVNKSVPLYQNGSAKIVSMGIIGTRYIEIDPGDNSAIKIEDGGTIASSEANSLDSILDSFASAVDSEKNGNLFENLAESVNSLKQVINNVSDHNQAIGKIINNFDEISSNLVTVSAQLNILIAKIDSGSGTVATLLNDDQIAQNLKETIASAKDAVQGLKDTLGTTSRLRFQWDYMGRYSLDDQVFRNDLGVKISPSDGKFYYLGVANLGNTSEADETNPANSMNKLEAYMGFRVNKVEFYGGILRGQGGLGAGISLFEPIYAPYKKVQLHINVYDFGRKILDGTNQTKPRVDAQVKVGITKFLYTGVIFEDILYRTGITPYIKLEIYDEDITRLLGIVGIAATTAK